MSLPLTFVKAILVSLAVVFFVVAPRVTLSPFGSTYYVSPQGSDTNDGSFEQPWKTLNKACAAVASGSTIIMRGGSYPDNYCHGTTPNIILKASTGEIPVITGNPTYGMFLNLSSGWIVDGITISDTAVSTSVQVSIQGAGTILRNSRLKNNAGDTMVRVLSSSSITIENCVFDTTGGDLVPTDTTSGFGAGDHIYVLGSHHVLIQGNQFSRAGHAAMDIINSGSGTSDPAFVASHDIVIRRNRIEQHWGGGIYISRGSYRTLVEENEIYYAGEGVTSYPKTGLQIAGESGIWRRNIIGWPSVSPMANTGITVAGYYYGGIIQNVRLNRVYNNVVYKAGWMPFILIQKDDSAATQNKFANNVFYYSRLAGIKNPYWPDGSTYLGFDTYHANVQWTDFPHENYFLGNDILHADASGDKPDNPRIIYHQSREVADLAYSLTQAEQQFPGFFVSNRAVNPQFVNADARDFRLASGSPMIDSGVSLARTTGAGNSNVIPMDDPYWFSDGFGVITGDVIRIGTATATITNVDLAGKKLTVDHAVTFESGAAVNLDYRGAGLDVGAIESGGGTTSPSPTPTPSASPTPSPIPSPSPTPVPTPTPCTMTVDNPVVPQWGNGKLVVTFAGITQPGNVSASATSGQVTVSPSSRLVSGTSMIAEFLLQAKKKSSSVIVTGPCGSKTVMVNVQ